MLDSTECKYKSLTYLYKQPVQGALDVTKYEWRRYERYNRISSGGRTLHRRQPQQPILVRVRESISNV